MQVFVSALLITILSLGSSIYAQTVVTIRSTESNKPLGTVKMEDTKYGLLLTPDLGGLSPGMHGFHIHEGHQCDRKGQAAGGHLDPRKTGKHLGPYNDKGHLGDLPALFFDKDGKVSTPVLAPRLKLKDVRGGTLMIHKNPDNYSDSPEPLGGSGAREACGSISS